MVPANFDYISRWLNELAARGTEWCGTMEWRMRNDSLWTVVVLALSIGGLIVILLRRRVAGE
jgi:hypothetical protein